VTFGERSGVRELLSRAPSFASAHTIGNVYDDIYTHRAQVWEDQGRTPQFISYFAELAASCSAGRLLEIGCGEGFLLEKLRALEKVAIDISAAALRRAHARTGAHVSVALAERLPFASKYFDLVVTVGVMEHFLDDGAATAEIARALKDDGWYLALIHVQRTAQQKAVQKLREYFYPRFRPRALLRWLGSKLHKPIQQPIQNDYTVESARALLETHGFEVVRVVARANEPEAPLVGPHVVIYMGRRRAALTTTARQNLCA
jgi:SAM-dependent methyltransferase